MGIWILVTKKLPKNNELVLYKTVSGLIGSGYYDNNTTIWYKSDMLSPVLEKVLMWQKAPRI